MIHDDAVAVQRCSSDGAASGDDSYQAVHVYWCSDVLLQRWHSDGARSDSAVYHRDGTADAKDRKHIHLGTSTTSDHNGMVYTANNSTATLQ